MDDDGFGLGAQHAACVVYLAAGSNAGEREAHLQSAVDGLRQLPATEIMALSVVYETAPQDMDSDAPFLNGVIKLRTSVRPELLLRVCESLELARGRELSTKGQGQDRPLDLDLLLYGDETSDTQRLQLPHPRLEERLFVLRPLADVAPHLVLPASGQSIGLVIRIQESGDAQVARAAWQWS